MWIPNNIWRITTGPQCKKYEAKFIQNEDDDFSKCLVICKIKKKSLLSDDLRQILEEDKLNIKNQYELFL